MSKIVLGLVPACITFGPLFMTRIGGMARSDATNLEFTGAVMLSVGLGILFRYLMKLRRQVDELRSLIETASPAEPSTESSPA